MNDRMAFRGLVTVASLLFFCLICLFTLPFRLGWLITSIWAVCCSILMTQREILQVDHRWIAWLITILAGLVFSLMLKNGLLTAWKLWGVTRSLVQATQTARLPWPPIVTRLAAKLDLAGALVVVPGTIPFSFCYGLWRPRICLSQGLVELLSETELEAVLHHEAYHLRRREPLRMAISLCLSRFFFFAPLLAELHERYLVEKELTADAAAVALTGRAALAGALHKLVLVNTRLTVPPLAAIAGLSVTAQRVDQLVVSSTAPPWTPSLRSILSTLALFILGCLPVIMG